MYTCINTYNVLARVIWPATFARSAGPPGGQNGRTDINKYIYILVNAEHYGRAGANPPSLTVRDHVYTCRLVPCFISFFPQLNCHHGHVTVPVDIEILLLYIYNYAHLVFNEIT